MDTISRSEFDTANPGLYQLDEPPVFREQVFDVSTGEFISAHYQSFVRIRQGMGEPLPEGIQLETHVTPTGNLVILQEGRINGQQD